MKVPFFKLSPVDKEIEFVTEVLKSGWLTTASKTAELERNFKEFCKVAHALAVNSCTAGLHLSLEALGVSRGDKVIVPSLTFTASAEVIRYLDADPIIVDCDPETGLLTKEIVKNACDKYGEIKACVIVHYSGQSAEMTGIEGIIDFCESRQIKTVVDAAHAFPAYDTYGPVGSVGDITCFSFYANKTMTTGEGGMIVTNSQNLADRIKVMRLHGINRDIWDRFTKRGASWEYDVVAPGYKYNMPDVNAAIGIAQFHKADEFRLQRQRIADIYTELLSREPRLKIFKSRVKRDYHAWHLFPIVLNSKFDRNVVIDKLTAKEIGTSVHYKPLHQLDYYKSTYNLSSADYPHSEKIWQSCLSLPIYPCMTTEQAKYVVESLLDILSELE